MLRGLLAWTLALLQLAVNRHQKDAVLALFQLAMDRTVPQLVPVDVNSGVVLNLGAGNKVLPGTIPLDRPQWDAEKDPSIRYEDGSVSHIFAFHFLEHLRRETVVAVLKECQRVLKPGGTINICVPLHERQLAIQDLDHKTPFCETTWKTLLRNEFYDPTPGFKCQLEIGTNLIMAIAERNLVVLTQLIKKSE